MILRHSAKPKPDPIPTPTPRTPDSAYARCDDCGTSAGEPCYDSNDRPCAPCPGRVLADSGSLARREQVSRYRHKARETAPRKEQKARQPRTYTPTGRASRAAPAHPCAFCGVMVGAGAKYCAATECQTERRRVLRCSKQPLHCLWCHCEIRPGCKWCKKAACQTERRRINDADRQKRRLATPVPCCVCGVMVPGRSDHATRPICGAIDCKRRRQRELRQEHRSRVRARSRSTTPRETEQHHDA